MDFSKCAAQCGQLLVILVGFVMFFGGVPVLLISLDEHSEPYWIIIGSLIVIVGVLVITLGASGCCKLYSLDEESGLPYGHLEEEIKTEGLIPGIYSPYRPYTNQGKFEHWVDIQIAQTEKNTIVENGQQISSSNHNNIKTHCNMNDNSVIDLGNKQSISKCDLINHHPIPT